MEVGLPLPPPLRSIITLKPFQPFKSLAWRICCWSIRANQASQNQSKNSFICKNAVPQCERVLHMSGEGLNGREEEGRGAVYNSVFSVEYFVAKFPGCILTTPLGLFLVFDFFATISFQTILRWTESKIKKKNEKKRRHSRRHNRRPCCLSSILT